MFHIDSEEAPKKSTESEIHKNEKANEPHFLLGWFNNLSYSPLNILGILLNKMIEG